MPLMQLKFQEKVHVQMVIQALSTQIVMQENQGQNLEVQQQVRIQERVVGCAMLLLTKVCSSENVKAA